MPASVGAISASEKIIFNPEMERDEQKKKKKRNVDDENLQDDHEDGANVKCEGELVLGPQFCLKAQLDKNKDDKSTGKWKEQPVGENKGPEVQIVSLSIMCPGRPDMRLPLPVPAKSKARLFILKEATPYRLRFSFTVSNNIVSGLKYANTVWKTGVRVDSSKVTLGTFSPKQEPYTYELEEDTTPSGVFGRGSYSARTKVIDDDGKCYLDITYSFEILKKWPSL